MTINDWLEESPDTRCAIRLNAMMDDIAYERVLYKVIRKELPCSECEFLVSYFCFIMPVDYIEERLEPVGKGICRAIDSGFFDKYFNFALTHCLAFSLVVSAVIFAMFTAGWTATEEKHFYDGGSYLCFEYTGL